MLRGVRIWPGDTVRKEEMNARGVFRSRNVEIWWVCKSCI